MQLFHEIRHGVAVLGNISGLLKRADPPPLRPSGPRDAQPHGTPVFDRGHMVLSSDIGNLMRLSEGAPPDGDRPDFEAPGPRQARDARRPRAVPPALPAPDVTAVPGVPVVSTTATATATTTQSPDAARDPAMTPRALLEEVGRCAAGFEDRDCSIDPRNRMPYYGRKFTRMVTALKQQQGRTDDVALLYNAELALHGAFWQLGQMVARIRHIRPDLDDEIEDWADDIIARSIDAALQLPPKAHLLQRRDPTTYAPVHQFIARPIDEHVTTLVARHEARMDRQVSQAIDASFREIYTPGDRSVAGAAADISQGDDLRAFLNGKILFRCSIGKLFELVELVPAGRIFPYPPRPFDAITYFGSTPPTRYFAVYDRPNVIRSVHWQGPDAGARKQEVLIKADESLGQLLSVDEGLSWHPTGVRTKPAFEALRYDRWRSFVELRRKDADDPRWRSRLPAQPPGWPQ